MLASLITYASLACQCGHDERPRMQPKSRPKEALRRFTGTPPRVYCHPNFVCVPLGSSPITTSFSPLLRAVACQGHRFAVSCKGAAAHSIGALDPVGARGACAVVIAVWWRNLCPASDFNGIVRVSLHSGSLFNRDPFLATTVFIALPTRFTAHPGGEKLPGLPSYPPA